MMMKSEIIGNYLDELFPNPVCELDYTKDYELLIAVMLSAQCTDKRVNMVTKKLFSKYDNLEKLSCADIDDLESIIRSLGSFRKKSLYIKTISKALLDYDCVPSDREFLESLPGIGRKTVNVFFSEYLDIPAIAVDTHVERVSKRLKLAFLDDDVIIVERKLQKKFDKSLWSRRHLQLVLFGRYKCKAMKPECGDCKIRDLCREKKKN